MTAIAGDPALGPRRRGVEITLVALAMLVTVFAYIDVGFGHSSHFPTDTITYGLPLAATFFVAHLAVRRLAPYADPVLLPTAAALNGLGLVLIHRLDLASADTARAAHRPPPTSDARLQLMWTIVGILLFVAVLAVIRDHRILQRYTYTLMVVGLALLFLPTVLPARFSEVNGAHIWIRVGGLSFEPEEVAKLALEAFFAGYLVAKRDLLALAGRRIAGVDLPRGRDLGPVLVAWLASVAVLGLESDIGTSLMFFGIFIVMLYVATERRSWVVIGIGLFLVGTFAAYHLFAHVKERFVIWLHPFKYVQGNAYQLVQGLFGLATGGILGTGLGQGRPGIVPFAKTDFIAATIGEELGLVGLMAVLVIYILLVARGLRAALSVRDGFGKLLAVGLAFGLALQVFVQIGGVTRLIPLTGITLPFLSYGGSSLVANWMLVALLLRISDSARRPMSALPPSPPTGPDQAMTQVVQA
ncbi:MAG TPA: FtsW/RodA/SpoVE family cell cycle protein [Mycobacteriales bacterium]|nr:FtsW/RodA/SpoVE family cell cycle protein [Mycobacteriales bacterium]